MTREEKLNATVYHVEQGVLLDKDDKEYQYYSQVYDEKNAYYDETQEYDCCNLEDKKKQLLYLLKNHAINKSYAVITNQGLLKNYYGYKITDETELSEIKQNLNDCWEQPDYSLNNVVWSAYKDENGNIIEDFIKKEQ